MQHMTKRVEIIPAKRRAMILDHLRRDGAASIQELSAQTGASSSTIRRDLEQLVEGGYLERTHGGALLMPAQRAAFEREPAINAHLRTEEKRAIGAEAARRLRSRDSVILEASSTVLEAALAATSLDLSLTVVTNSLDIALAGAAVPDWRVIMPGGTIRPGSRMLAGEPGQAFFQTVHADLCFTGAYAVTGSVLTDATLEIPAAEAGDDRRLAAQDPARRQLEIRRACLFHLLRPHRDRRGDHRRWHPARPPRVAAVLRLEVTVVTVNRYLLTFALD